MSLAPKASLSAEEDSICVGCGLCCDGTLHNYTRVKEKDEAAVALACLEVVELEGKRLFRQPCSHFSNGRCRIYERRPPVCQTYRCALLEGLDEGRISALEARQKIAKAKLLVSLVSRGNGDGVTSLRRSQLQEALRAELVGASQPRRTEIAKALLDLGVLNHYLTRWFYKSDDAAQMGEDSGRSTEQKDARRT